MHPFGTPPVLPPKTGPIPFSAWIVGAGLILVATSLIGMVWAVGTARERDERLMQSMSQQMDQDMLGTPDWSPDIRERPFWNKDVLSVKFIFSSDTVQFKDLKLTDLIVDGYPPDKELPIRVPPFSPKKPSSIVVKFPGYTSKGGKYARFGCGVEYPIGGPEPTAPPLVNFGEDPWSQDGPSIYIPLRAGAKTPAKKESR